MEEKVLIIKKDKDRMKAKIRRRAKNQFVPDDYSKVFNPKDPNDLALLFEDLEILISAPIDRAFRTYQERKKHFPFF